jgi:hypothetical protein
MGRPRNGPGRLPELRKIEQDATGEDTSAAEATECRATPSGPTPATIASAVEEQSATTNEITRNVNGDATGSSSIAENITSVASASQTTTPSARGAPHQPACPPTGRRMITATCSSAARQWMIDR